MSTVPVYGAMLVVLSALLGNQLPLLLPKELFGLPNLSPADTVPFGYLGDTLPANTVVIGDRLHYLACLQSFKYLGVTLRVLGAAALAAGTEPGVPPGGHGIQTLVALFLLAVPVLAVASHRAVLSRVCHPPPFCSRRNRDTSCRSARCRCFAAVSSSFDGDSPLSTFSTAVSARRTSRYASRSGPP